MRTVRTFGTAALLGVLALAGCGSSSSSNSSSTAHPARAVTVHAANGTVTIPAPPKRIVSLSPTTTEMLFAIGAGRQVTAVDDQSDYPANAPRTKLSGYKPNAEAVIGYRPDLVVVSDNTGGIVASLTKVKIPVLVEPAATNLNDSYTELAGLGTATGHSAQATQVSNGMRTRIAALVAGVPKKTGVTYFYELSPDLFTATSKTFIGQLFTMFGLTNIADKADAQGSGYPKISAEYLLKADPRYVFLADTLCCRQSVTTVAKRPGWAAMAAVRQAGVVPLNDDIASRWGPRVVDLVQAIANAMR
jgi:iron complex transport system substrate-binding protein